MDVTHCCNVCGTENHPNNLYCSNCGHATPLSIGLELGGRFTINEALGNGGMARIYLGTDNEFPDKPVAIKEMLLSSTDCDERQKLEEKFRQEAQILRGLNYPGIPKIYSYLTRDNRHFLVMELIPGSNLRQISKNNNRNFSEKETTDIILKILDILNYLHSQRPRSIIHSDIKPDNIMYNEGIVYLIDFGVVILLCPDSCTSKLTRRTIYFTLEYLDPEVIRNSVALPRNDLYSLGMTMLWMLTGCEEANKAEEKLLEKGIRLGLIKIIVKSLNEISADKFQTALEMKDWILRFLENEDSMLDVRQVTSNYRSMLARSDVSSLNITLRNLLADLENFFREFSGESSCVQSFHLIIEKIKEYTKFFCDNQNDFESRKTITSFILHLIHWGEISLHLASSELIISLCKCMKGFLDKEILGTSIQHIIEPQALKEYVLFLKNIAYFVTDDLSVVKQLFSEIVQNPQQSIEIRNIVFAMRHWDREDLFQVGSQMVTDDPMVPIIVRNIKDQCWDRFSDKMLPYSMSVCDGSVLKSILGFAVKLEKTQLRHFESLAFTILYDYTISVGEFVIKALSNWINDDQQYRLYICEYLEIMIRLANKLKVWINSPCSNKIIIQCLGIVCGRTIVTVQSFPDLIFCLINYCFKSKNQFHERFANLKTLFLNYLDNFTSDADKIKEVATLIKEIEKN